MMDKQHLEKVEALFQAAVELPIEERDVFLTDKCRGDTGLKNEVESLLRFESSEPLFLDSPPASLAAEIFSNKESDPLLAVGQIGRYRMERLLGDHAIEVAMHDPPEDTRAYFRGRCITRFPDAIAAAPDQASAHVGLANACVMQFEATRADVDRDVAALAIGGDVPVVVHGGGAEASYNQGVIMWNAGKYADTGNPTDLAILDGGESFFVVEKDDKRFLTRAGNFHFDAVPAGNVKLALDGRTATNAPTERMSVGVLFLWGSGQPFTPEFDFFLQLFHHLLRCFFKNFLFWSLPRRASDQLD